MRNNVVIVILLSICVWLYGCFGKDVKDFRDLLANAPKVGTAVCGFTNADAFRYGEGTWKDSAEVRYYIEYGKVTSEGEEVENYFNKADKKYITEQIDKAFDKWRPHFKKPIREVDDKKKCNALILFKLLTDDGIGGVIMISDFPPNKNDYVPKGERKIPTIRCDLYDTWQLVKDRDKPKLTFKNVFEHECGHLLVALMHNNEYSIMNPNNKWKTVTIEDAIAMRTVLGYRENFDFERNRYTWIQNSPAKATLNFTQAEFYSHCNIANYSKGHFLSTITIAGIQFLRTYYDCPIEILSSARDIYCNKNAGGAVFSQHIFFNALDWKFVGKNAAKARRQYIADVKSFKGALPQMLAIGITGFGSYPSGSFHIDSRYVAVGNRSYNKVQFITWGSFRSANEHAFILFDDYSKFD